MVTITEESTRFIFRDYSPNELAILRKLVSAEEKTFLYEDKEFVACPIGLENYIKRKFPDIKIEIKPPWVAARMKYIPKEMPEPRNKLQKDALKFLSQHKDKPQLGLITNVGSGKTYMAIRHAIFLGTKTLVICPSTTILQQWIDTLKDMFQVPDSRILFVSSPAKISQAKGDYDWVLVLEQSLQTQLDDYKLEDTMKSGAFGLKIIDEIHMFLKNNIAIDCCSNIKNGLYLTGTFFRTQEEESNLFTAVYHGILRFEVVEQEDIEKYGQPKHVEIYSVVIDSRLTRREVSHIIIRAKLSRRKSTNVVSIGRYMQTVCPEDSDRITEYMKQCLQVIKRMRERVNYGRMLVLVPSINATRRFRSLVAEMFPNLKVGTINSTQARSLNTTVKQQADIVISTAKSAGVGFDMKDLSILIAVEQFRSAVLVEQISGRLRPRADKKSTYYVDIADKALGRYMMTWRDDRLKLLKKKAKDYKTFIPPAGDK
jgi:superfamily II DNA or RNA helicase